MAWTSPLTWVAGQVVTAAQLNTHVRDNLNDLSDGSWGRDLTFVVKAADEGLANSAVVQNDNHLFFTATANAKYLVDVALFVTVGGGSSGSDFKVGWSLPSGTFNMSGHGPDVAMAATSSVGSAEFVGLVGAVTSTPAYGLDSDGNTGIKLWALIEVGGTGGTVTLQWAQNTATAVTTTLEAGSWLRAERVA